MIYQLSVEIAFPHPSLADEDGLIAIGGDLSIERIQLAYKHGIFPWYSEDEPILWYSPHQRFVLFPKEIRISKSMHQIINSRKYEIRWNTSFKEVIFSCAQIPRKGQAGTWIHEDMINAYTLLSDAGIAQSVEIWRNQKLVGGLYGVVEGKVFCGESMFSMEPNTSKLALIALCLCGKYEMIDCQIHTQHLEKMGARFISRAEFMKNLKLV